jgi:hypothetical protein
MQTNPVADPRCLRGPRGLPSRYLVTMVCREVDTPTLPCQQTFMAVQAAYRSIGGLRRSDEVVALLEPSRDLDTSQLGLWRLERRVVGFDWQSCTWWPCFQFPASGPWPLPGVHDVLAVLGAVFNDWDVVRWFARPHPALGERAPAEVIAGDLAAVLRTARGDRFVARG